MKKHAILLLLPLLLTGCGTEHISERIYTQSLGIAGEEELTLYGQPFGEGKTFSGSGTTAAEALRQNEAAQGGSIFIGHTELLCLDGSRTEEEVQDLLLERGLSPACKLLYTQVEQTFRHADPASVLKSIRMAEENGLVPLTDISTVLEEWLGSKKTALLPALADDGLQMVFLHTDGTAVLLSPEAARGLYWLRSSTGSELTLTAETADGMQDIAVTRSSLRKRAADGMLIYELTVQTDNCPEDVKSALRRKLLSECRTAVGEMLSAGADVIGMETLADFGGLEEEEAEVEIVVRVK